MPPADATAAKGSSRPLPRWLLLLAAALLVARVGAGVWEQRHAPPRIERVAWVPIDRAETESRRSGKPILYEFSADWCGPCKTLSSEVFSDPDAAARIARLYVPVRVVDRQQEEGRNPPDVARLQQQYAVHGFPTLVVANPGRAEFRSIDGYRGARPTRDWLEQNARESHTFRLDSTGFHD